MNMIDLSMTIKPHWRWQVESESIDFDERNPFRASTLSIGAQHRTRWSGLWGSGGTPGGPPERTLMGITTMCGHGLVSVNLVRDLISRINRNRMSIEKAAEILAKPCICGIFNPKRAAEILAGLTDPEARFQTDSKTEEVAQE